MSDRSLAAAIEAAGGPVELLRDLGLGRFTKLPAVYTHWIEEQRAWRETCALADQSYHMTDLHVEGSDAVGLYSDYAANDFTDFAVGRAKQLVVCNPDGYLIGDAIIFRLGEREFLSVGAAAAHNWLAYQVETGDYDVTYELQPRPVATGDDPNNFRLQVQGPTAYDVMAEAVDGELPDLSFFGFESVTIDGNPVKLLRHGMAGEPGFEFWGPYSDKIVVRDAVLEAGREHDIRRLGSKSYQSANTVLGWVPLPVPAIYDSPALADYRDWLDAKRGMISIGGSFDSDDITDYYITPVELGYDRFIDLDHDFVGRDALADEIHDPSRTKVTLEWHDDDVIDAFGTLFAQGETAKQMALPVPRSSACHYDTVRKDGEHVGVSKWMSYIYNERKLLSLAIIDVDQSQPGTEVSLIWGEASGAANPQVERHRPTEIRATVAPSPYSKDRR